MMSPAQQRAIEENRQLQRAGIRTGKRRVYWVGYWSGGEWVRECYPTQGQMRGRAFELLNLGVDVAASPRRTKTPSSIRLDVV